ncbi:glyoxylate/hydroxypyruvate reductase A [Pollutimonas subterranea]|uniref:Glyoxylate/hydroxypyruvate reductase A n=1 Tax=Pollutimonas subterranea TaxID=2045210 RepID=A0A2N4U224_9BURK|nr:glyoxylate/hydroxypyruvate reductase A [Pollutimonas subterranea]PLC49056.1 glyoxylate/hydroxypyruvate reductase A [Pollutimonas subterranea]
MKIIFASAHDVDPDTWINPLKALIPDAEIHPWVDNGPTIDAQLAIVWNPPADIFLREPALKAVFNLGAGVDAIIKRPGLRDDVAVVRLEDAGMSAQMAEYAVYALVRASRQFDQYEKQQEQQVWQPLPDIQRQKWTVGVMGLGVMGTRVAQTLAGLDYPVAGWSRSAKEIAGVESFSGTDQLPAFLARTRVLINTLPLTAETTGILCLDTLRQLRPGAYLVNVGRGEHLVEADLLALLDAGHISGATLDVFREEPLPQGHPFWQDPRITITPHTAAASLREETIAQVAGNIRRYMRGEPLTGVVVRDRGY